MLRIESFRRSCLIHATRQLQQGAVREEAAQALVADLAEANGHGRLRRSDAHGSRDVYPPERQRGRRLSYKDAVATATTNVHLATREAQITRPRNGDLDF